MSRTPEQKAADEAVTAAVEAQLAAYSEPGEEPALLTDYVVLSAQRGFDDDGRSFTTYASMPRDGDLPIHVLLGLTAYAAANYKQMATAEDDE